jgi:hypothetical protein
MHMMAPQAAGATLIALGLSLLLKYLFSYHADSFPEMSIAGLLKCVKVSSIRPIPCSLTCTIVGKGIPGYVLSEDFVGKDVTGIMLFDFRQPWPIWEWIFAFLKADNYIGKEVTVEGWYRRAPVPMVEIRSIARDGKAVKSWLPFTRKVTALLVLALGMFILA